MIGQLLGLRTLQRFQILFSPLHINSLYLLGGTAASGVLGFLFWIIAARWSSTANVGLTTATISSTALIVSLCDLGLSVTLIHAITKQHSQHISIIHTISALGWMISGVAALVFLFGIPIFAPKLEILQDDIAVCCLLLLFVMVNYVLGLQDGIAMALRKAKYVFWRNLACNLPSLVLLPIVVSFLSDFRGILIAYCLPNFIVVLCTGLYIMPRYITGYKLFGEIRISTLKEILPYGLKNYVSNILWGIVGFALPVLSINIATPSETAKFFIIWTIFNFLLIVPRSVSASMFVEGTIRDEKLQSIALRALMMISIILLPGFIFLWFFGNNILLLFGKNYVDTHILRILLVSLPFFSINSIYFIALRVKNNLLQLISFSFLTSFSIISCIIFLIPRYGLHSLSLGWLFGHAFVTMLVVFPIIGISRFAHRNQL